MTVPTTMPTRVPTPMLRGCGILPPYLLQRLAQNDDPRIAAAAAASLRVDTDLRGTRDVRAARADRPGGPVTQGGLIPPHLQARTQPVPPTATAPRTAAGRAKAQRSVYDAAGGTSLPGTLKRKEGGRKVTDVSINEAYTGLGDTWSLYYRCFGRDSLDGHGLPLVASVHYGQRYDNAFWDGAQMVFGDGDGVIFNRFTASVDVIGHELSHGFTQYTAGLIYLAQSGALNESISDVFGSLVKQRTLKQTADEADWLIGEGLFTAKVEGVALRSMKAPGTAYDDDQLGKDPQPADMDHYDDLPHDADHDNGGVHINSGIPNRAFYLAATGIGGNAWEKPGQIWYDTVTEGSLPKDCDFATFATATVAAAEKRYGSGAESEAVQQAWTTVKVLG